MGRPSFYVQQAHRHTATSVEGTYTSTEHTVGPWSPLHQHAGPPTALLLRAIEQLGDTEAPIPRHALPARLTAEIFRPVPVTDLRVTAALRRPGRRVAWAVAELCPADEPDQPVMRAAVWFVRRAAAALDLPTTDVRPAPGPGTPRRPPAGWGGGYLDAVTWAPVAGGFDDPGPATVWTQLRVDLVDGESPTGPQRAAVVADAGSGISAVADPAAVVFVNTELTIHLHREPVGEQVWMDARTMLDPHGVGHAHTALGDSTGAVGAADQTLYVAPR